MTYRIRNIVVAVGLALLAMMLTLFYVTNYKRSVQNDASSVQVYVAAKDVPVGTSGTDLIKQHALKQESVQRRAHRLLHESHLERNPRHHRPKPSRLRRVQRRARPLRKGP